MGSRRQAREFALQALYLCDSCSFPIDQAVRTSQIIDLPEHTKKFSTKLVEGVLLKKEEIDATIMKYAANWELNRMAAVDRNILRISTYEILSDIDTPISVIIDEAIEISKLYSTQESGKFINGILDKIKLERTPPKGT